MGVAWVASEWSVTRQPGLFCLALPGVQRESTPISLGSGVQRAGEGGEGRGAGSMGQIRGRGGSLEGEDGVGRAGSGGHLRRDSGPELSSVPCGWGFCKLQVLLGWKVRPRGDRRHAQMEGWMTRERRTQLRPYLLYN